jgi:hypothetical protein
MGRYSVEIPTARPDPLALMVRRIANPTMIL